MKIRKLRIVNYKKFNDITIEMNDDINIFVGENDSGKTTILEALAMVLTGKINGNSIMAKFTPDWFNADSRKKYIESLSSEIPDTPPIIVIEAFFKDEDDPKLINFRGTNNLSHEDAIGVKLEIKFNEEYSPTYKSLLSEDKVTDIPIEFYKVEFRSFANPDYYISMTVKKLGIIDTTKKDYGVVLNKFVSNSISTYLSEEEETNLRLAYRSNRKDFTESMAVKNLNEKISQENLFKDKVVSLNLRENEIDGWKNEIVLSIDNIQFDYLGFGSQNMLKSELFILQNADIDILIFEEPENNLSYTNMSILVNKLCNSKKQIFMSTHSSFIANKLGLNNVHLVCDNKISSLRALQEDTYNFFLKLSGYNTLRLLLANSIILVEGPADELIIQKAYYDEFGKYPIADGIDIMAIGGVAFERYCELAEIISKDITIVPDNDHDPQKVKNKYDKFVHTKLCIETDETLNTLEPSVLNANKNNFDKFKEIIYKGNDIKRKSYQDIEDFMINNKTEWGLRVYLSNEKIEYPIYILDAIGKRHNEK